MLSLLAVAVASAFAVAEFTPLADAERPAADAIDGEQQPAVHSGLKPASPRPKTVQRTPRSWCGTPLILRGPWRRGPFGKITPVWNQRIPRLKW